MFSADVANMHWLLTMHLQCRINLCIDVRSFIGGFVHLTWHFTGTWSTFHGMHVTDVKIWHWFRSHRCLLTPEPFPGILDQVTASCDRYQTRTVAGKVTCSGAVAHMGRAVREAYHQRTGHRWNGGWSGQLFISWSVKVRLLEHYGGKIFGGSRGAPTLQLVLYKDVIFASVV